jgi:hypothetical protein
MHSSVLAGALAAWVRMSASQSRGIIHIHSRVVAIASHRQDNVLPVALGLHQNLSAAADPLTTELVFAHTACQFVVVTLQHR